MNTAISAGASPMENSAARIIEILEMVPVSELSSKALEVPVPCAAVPSETPRATSFSMWKRRSTEGPIIVPSTPVRMTKTAVMLGTPPMLCEMLMAIGVVTERGTRLVARSPLRCINLASSMDDSTAVTVPDSTPAAISAACF